jgi:hypothetical protein
MPQVAQVPQYTLKAKVRLGFAQEVSMFVMLCS